MLTMCKNTTHINTITLTCRNRNYVLPFKLLKIIDRSAPPYVGNVSKCPVNADFTTNERVKTTASEVVLPSFFLHFFESKYLQTSTVPVFCSDLKIIY